MGKYWNLSPETREKQRKARLGRTQSDETKRKISQSVKKNYENKGWYRVPVDSANPEAKGLYIDVYKNNGTTKFYHNGEELPN